MKLTLNKSIIYGLLVTGAIILIAILLSIPGKKIIIIREAKAAEVIRAEVSGYSSEVSQTDDSPFITASNQTVRFGIVANNCLPFGSEVSINGITYEVQDRMNRRYSCDHYDIWFPSKELALEFGRQELEVEIKQ